VKPVCALLSLYERCHLSQHARSELRAAGHGSTDTSKCLGCIDNTQGEGTHTYLSVISDNIIVSSINTYISINGFLLCLQQIWPGLRTVEYELSIVKFLQQHVKEGERWQAANRAALIHLEAQVINVACDDPGRAVGATVLLPMLRERIESQAYAHYNKDVLLAEQRVRPTRHLSASACVV